MIVFIGGMQRSGSTFCFNIAREMLSRNGPVYSEPTYDVVQAQSNAGNAHHILLKAHRDSDHLRRLILAGAARAICSIRSPEDAIASWIDTFGFELEGAVQEFELWFGMYRAIQRSCLTIDYEIIEQRPAAAAGMICRYLGFGEGMAEQLARKYSKASVMAMVQDIRRGSPGIRDIGFSCYDEVTFFHRGHIASLDRRNAAQTLSRDDLHRIRNALGGCRP